MMTGMYGPAKMRDGERICNLTVYVVQRGHTVVEIIKYDTENAVLFDFNERAFNRIIWPGKSTRMPASGTGYREGMYKHDVTHFSKRLPNASSNIAIN